MAGVASICGWVHLPSVDHDAVYKVPTDIPAHCWQLVPVSLRRNYDAGIAHWEAAELTGINAVLRELL